MKQNFKDKINTAGFNKHPENINTKGKEPGTKNRATILKKWIEINAKITDPETKKVSIGTMEDKIALALVAKANTGDVAAIKEINDTLYGKIAEKGEFKTESQVNLNVIDFSDISTTDLKALKEIINKKQE